MSTIPGNPFDKEISNLKFLSKLKKDEKFEVDIQGAFYKSGDNVVTQVASDIFGFFSSKIKQATNYDLDLGKKIEYASQVSSRMTKGESRKTSENHLKNLSEHIQNKINQINTFVSKDFRRIHNRKKWIEDLKNIKKHLESLRTSIKATNTGIISLKQTYGNTNIVPETLAKLKTTCLKSAEIAIKKIDYALRLEDIEKNIIELKNHLKNISNVNEIENWLKFLNSISNELTPKSEIINDILKEIDDIRNFLTKQKVNFDRYSKNLTKLSLQIKPFKRGADLRNYIHTHLKQTHKKYIIAKFNNETFVRVKWVDKLKPQEIEISLNAKGQFEITNNTSNISTNKKVFNSYDQLEKELQARGLKIFDGKVDKKFQKLMSKIEKAVPPNDFKKLLNVLRKYPESPEEIEKIAPPIHIAARFGNERLLELAVKQGYNINQKAGPRKSTPVEEAIISYNPRLIPKLIELGANVKGIRKYGRTLLHTLCEANQLQRTTRNKSLKLNLLNQHELISTIKLLMNKGNDINAVDIISQETVLHLLARSKMIEPLLFALEHSKDVNHQNVLGQNALHILLEQNKLVSAQRLKLVTDIFKQKGGNLETKDKRGRTIKDIIKSKIKQIFNLRLEEKRKDVYVDKFTQKEQKVYEELTKGPQKLKNSKGGLDNYQQRHHTVSKFSEIPDSKYVDSEIEKYFKEAGI